jgi:hypothetical protein
MFFAIPWANESQAAEQHLSKNREPAQRWHACDHVPEQQAPGAQNAGDRFETFDDVSIERALRGGAPSELIDVKTNEKQPDGGENKAEPCSVAGADEDQPQNCRRIGRKSALRENSLNRRKSWSSPIGWVEISYFP